MKASALWQTNSIGGMNPNKIDFYPTERFVEAVLTAMTLNFVWCVTFP